MAASILSPMSSSINSGPRNSTFNNKLSKSAVFKFGEDVNMIDSDDYSSDDEEYIKEYKPSWTGDKSNFDNTEAQTDMPKELSEPAFG